MTATLRGIKADGGRRGSFDDDTTREFTVVYLVHTDDRNDGPVEVRDAFGIPNLGGFYSAGNDFDGDAVAIGKQAEQVDGSPWDWEVEVTFSTDVETNPQDQIDNPLDRPVQYRYGFTNRRILVPGYYTSAGTPSATGDWEAGVVAPNGELFDPQPEVDISEPILTVVRNVQTISGAALMALADSVNATFYAGAEPRTLRMLAPEAESQWHKRAGYYWTVTTQLAYRYNTWDLQILNQGSYYWTGGKPTDVTSTTPKVKRDENGNPLIVNLTTDGDINTTSTPTFTRIRFYREVDFNSLGII